MVQRVVPIWSRPLVLFAVFVAVLMGPCYHHSVISTMNDEHQKSMNNLNNTSLAELSNQRQTMGNQCEQNAEKAGKLRSNITLEVESAVQVAETRFAEDVNFQVGKHARECDQNITLAKLTYTRELKRAEQNHQDAKMEAFRKVASLHDTLAAKKTCYENIEASAWCGVTALTGGLLSGVKCEL
eukprot:scpid86182/ scgid29815/ 